MKIYAKLHHLDGTHDSTTFEIDNGMALPNHIHWGGSVFECRSSVAIPLPDGGFQGNLDYFELEVFSAELERSVVLIDDVALEEARVKIVQGFVDGAREDSPADAHLFAEILSRYIQGPVEPERDWELLAEGAFNAYNEVGPTPWVTFDGRPVPRWKELNDAVRGKWIASTKALVSEEVRRRRAAVTALEDLQHAFDREIATDGPVFNRGRSEGWSDIAAKLRAALPRNAQKLTLDGLIEKVRDGYSLLASIRLAHDSTMDSTALSREMHQKLVDWLHEDGSVGGWTLERHLARQQAFSLTTFGPGSAAERFAGIRDHILKELREIEASPHDLEEWIDVVILAFDGALRIPGASPESVIEALVSKQVRNLSRKWPDWRTAEPGKAIEHVREEKP